MISSSSNAKVKQVNQLKKKGKARREKGVFLVEGIKMVEEAYEYGIVEAYVAESAEQELMRTHRDLLTKLTYELVADKVFHEMSDTITPQGIMAIVKMPSYDLSTILNADHAHVMVLEDLRDPGNLGTILRSGEGCRSDRSHPYKRIRGCVQSKGNPFYNGIRIPCSILLCGRLTRSDWTNERERNHSVCRTFKRNGKL